MTTLATRPTGLEEQPGGAHEVETDPTTATGSLQVVIPHECEDPEAVAPVEVKRTRSVGIDAARGLAVLGMMAVHLLTPTLSDGTTPNPGWIVPVGRASIVFAVLAGFGVAVTTRRGDLGAARAGLFGRALAISAMGLAMAPVVEGHDGARALIILPQYGLLFLLAIPLLGLGWRALAALAVVLGAVTPVVHQLLRDSPVEGEPVNPRLSWVLSDPGHLLRTLTVDGGYPVLVWVTFLVAGMAIGRASVHSRRTMLGVTAVGAGLAVTTFLITDQLLQARGFAALEATSAATDGPIAEDIRLFGSEGTVPTTSWWWQAVPGPHTSTVADVFMGGGLALALIGSLMIIGHVTRAVLSPLAVLGSMPLTAYMLHLTMLHFDNRPQHEWADMLMQVAIIVAVILVWRQIDKRGPLEELVRTFSGFFSGAWTLVFGRGGSGYRPRHARG